MMGGLAGLLLVGAVGVVREPAGARRRMRVVNLMFGDAASFRELCVPVRSARVGGRKLMLSMEALELEGNVTMFERRIGKFCAAKVYVGFFYTIVLEYLDRHMWYEAGNERDSVTALALSPEASH